MKKIHNLFVVSVLALLAFFVVPGVLQATPITGSIAFGNITASPVPGPAWFNATGITSQSWISLSTSGDFTGVPIGTATTFSDIDWGSGTGAVLDSVGQIWTLTTGNGTTTGSVYTMYVGFATNIARGDSSNDHIDVQGFGTLKITGLLTRDETAGTWTFGASHSTGGSQSMHFSADAVGDSFDNPVPEPTTVVLFGSGLIVLILAKRSGKI